MSAIVYHALAAFRETGQNWNAAWIDHILAWYQEADWIELIWISDSGGGLKAGATASWVPDQIIQ